MFTNYVHFGIVHFTYMVFLHLTNAKCLNVRIFDSYTVIYKWFQYFQLNRYQDNKRLDQSEAVDQPKTVITGEFDISSTIMRNSTRTNFNI